MMDLLDTIPDMCSSDYKKRFVAEYNQISIRYKKLCSMMDKYEEGKLDFIPKTPMATLKAQGVYMLLYKTMLLHRAELEDINLDQEDE